MKNSISLKTCLMALCLLTVHGMSANAALIDQASKEVFTRSGVLAKFAQFELKNLVTTPEGIATSAFMMSLFIFFSREADNKPNRYNLEELKANPTFRNIFKFSYYFYLDGVIGHKRQSSSSKIGEDGKTIVVKPGIPPRGFLGHVAELTKPVSETLGFVKSSGEFIRDCIFGLVAWELLVKAEQKA
jgi:hypothetical protein